MTNPTTLPMPIALVSASARLGHGPTVAPDDGVFLCLAIWLAEVSAEATQGAEAAAVSTTATTRASRAARATGPARSEPA